MTKYTFAPITVRPFPTLVEVRNPWIINSRVKHLINVSDKEQDDIKAAILARGISYSWFPTVEKPTMDMPKIFLAVRQLHQYVSSGEPTVVHCVAGINRSRTVVEAYHYARFGKHLTDEYNGYQNHLIYNCASGYLPPLSQMEHWLSLLLK